MEAACADILLCAVSHANNLPTAGQQTERAGLVGGRVLSSVTTEYQFTFNHLILLSTPAMCGGVDFSSTAIFFSAVASLAVSAATSWASFSMWCGLIFRDR